MGGHIWQEKNRIKRKSQEDLSQLVNICDRLAVLQTQINKS